MSQFADLHFEKSHIFTELELNNFINPTVFCHHLGDYVFFCYFYFFAVWLRFKKNPGKKKHLHSIITQGSRKIIDILHIISNIFFLKICLHWKRKSCCRIVYNPLREEKGNLLNLKKKNITFVNLFLDLEVVVYFPASAILSKESKKN